MKCPISIYPPLTLLLIEKHTNKQTHTQINKNISSRTLLSSIKKIVVDDNFDRKILPVLPRMDISDSFSM